jgi:hypothetical protein
VTNVHPVKQIDTTTLRQAAGADDVDRRLTDRLALVPHVFLDPTQASAGLRESLLQAREDRDDAVRAGVGGGRGPAAVTQPRVGLSCPR